MPDEDIRNSLKEHGGQTDLALQKLLDAQEANLLGGVLDEATNPGADASPRSVSLEPVHPGDLPVFFSVFLWPELALAPSSSCRAVRGTAGDCSDKLVQSSALLSLEQLQPRRFCSLRQRAKVPPATSRLSCLTS